MILSHILEGLADCLHGLGYDAHDGPPPQLTPPAAVIELPDLIDYHLTAAPTEQLELTITVVVCRADAKDARSRLYAALSTEATPGVDIAPIQPALEAYDGPWRGLTVTSARSFGSISLGTTSPANGLAAQFTVSLRTRKGPTIIEESS